MSGTTLGRSGTEGLSADPLRSTSSTRSHHSMALSDWTAGSMLQHRRKTEGHLDYLEWSASDCDWPELDVLFFYFSAVFAICSRNLECGISPSSGQSRIPCRLGMIWFLNWTLDVLLPLVFVLYQIPQSKFDVSWLIGRSCDSRESWGVVRPLFLLIPKGKEHKGTFNSQSECHCHHRQRSSLPISWNLSESLIGHSSAESKKWVTSVETAEPSHQDFVLEGLKKCTRPDLSETEACADPGWRLGAPTSVQRSSKDGASCCYGCYGQLASSCTAGMMCVSFPSAAQSKQHMIQVLFSIAESQKKRMANDSRHSSTHLANLELNSTETGTAFWISIISIWLFWSSSCYGPMIHSQHIDNPRLFFERRRQITRDTRHLIKQPA